MAAKSTIALDINLNGKQAEQSVASFRQQLKIATQDLVAMSEKFGVTSVEAANAARKVAGLKDAIGDAKALADTFNPDKKFVALSGALNGAVSGFSALQGAMGLFGAEGEEVQKVLLKVNSAMALQQGISGIAGSIDSFKILAGTIKKDVVNAFSTLNNAISTTILGGLVVVVGIAIANFDKLKEAISGVSKGQELLNSTQEEYNKGVTQAIEKTTQVKTAFDLARKGVISKEAALKTYNDTLGDSFGKTNDLVTAEKNLTDKAQAYIQITGLKAQANALFALSAKEAAKATLAETEDQTTFVDKSVMVIKSYFGATQSAIDGGLKAQADGVKSVIEDANKNVELLNAKGAELLTKAGDIQRQYGISDGTTASSKKLTPAQKIKEEGYQRIAAEKEIDGIRLANKTEAIGLQLNVEYEAYRKSMEIAKMNKDGQLALDQELYNQKMAFMDATAEGIGALSDIVGKETAAGKALAVAQSLINTYAAIVGQLRAATKSPGAAIPGYAIAQAVATGLVGFAAVKNILKVQVPGGGGGSVGSSIPSIGREASAPLQPAYTSTKLDPFALNQIGNAAARAYVIESDVSGNQEKIKRLNRAARIV